MKLHHPFIITPRLAPGLSVGGAFISFDAGRFVIDLPDGSEHVVTDFRFPACGIRGETKEDRLAKGFAAMLSFLSACAESRRYTTRSGGRGENADLFPENVGEWAESCSDELSMLSFEIEEGETSLIET